MTVMKFTLHEYFDFYINICTLLNINIITQYILREIVL